MGGGLPWRKKVKCLHKRAGDIGLGIPHSNPPEFEELIFQNAINPTTITTNVQLQYFIKTTEENTAFFTIETLII